MCFQNVLPRDILTEIKAIDYTSPVTKINGIIRANLEYIFSAVKVLRTYIYHFNVWLTAMSFMQISCFCSLYFVCSHWFMFFIYLVFVLVFPH